MHVTCPRPTDPKVYEPGADVTKPRSKPGLRESRHDLRRIEDQDRMPIVAESTGRVTYVWGKSGITHSEESRT
jgi:hypothetical protein